MAELDNIITLAGKFKSHLELQSYCDSQFLVIQKSSMRIRQLEEEIVHLKELVASTQPLLSREVVPQLIIKSSEQVICEMEIEKLREASMKRSLTLEETKRFDLLVKNLLLAKESQKEIKPDYKHIPDGYSEATLVALATIPEDSTSEQI